MLELLGAELAPVVAFMLIGEIAVFAVFVCAWVLARLHKGRYHHYVMLAAFLTDELVFKPLMTLRALEVYGPYPWPGTNIAPHLWLDIGVTALGVATVVAAFRFRVKKKGNMFMPPKGRIHRLLGYLFISLWAATLVLGIRIFAGFYL